MDGALRGDPVAERPLHATAAATATFVVSFMPTFLLGASSVYVRRDLGFDQAGLGLAVSAFMLSFAATSILGGRVAERLGAGRALAGAAFGSALVMLAIALLVQDYRGLVALLIVGGVVNGVAEPATNLALARGVRTRQGLMFGIKQSATPLVSLVAGASVPLVAATVGWRWTFVGGAVLGFAISLAVPSDLDGGRRRGAASRGRDGDASLGALVVFAVAGTMSAAAAIAMASFAVEGAVAIGIPVATAGWLLAGGSAAGVVGRLTAGWVADHFHEIELRLMSGMLAVGALGYALLASGVRPLYLVGLIVGYGFGWGYPGVLMLAIVRFNPNAPARASGIVLTGGAIGSTLGPTVFGFVASRGSFGLAWGLTIAAALLSAALLLVARSWLMRDQQRRAQVT